jgi:predicted TIM-barrel fold metal-dependent hydrolase
VRAGHRVWDADTHVRPTLETLEPYYDPALRARVGELEDYKDEVMGTERVTRKVGNHDYTFPGYLVFRRTLGYDVRDSVPQRGSGKKFMGTEAPSPNTEDDDPAARLLDMDREGVDVQLLVPGQPNPVGLTDLELQVGFVRAFNRYVADFASKAPDRLKVLLPVLGAAPEACAQEIRRYAGERWMVGVWPVVGNDLPLDHPSLAPIWEACDEAGLAVVHHSLSNAAPYFPGYRDLWDSRTLGRAASHPWGAMRALGAFLGGGLLEKYHNLRFGILESGCGWLPFWARRIDDQIEYLGGAAPLKETVEEQMRGGRFFASLEMAEKEDMVKMVVDFLGEDVLMYASDYPHPECRYPESVDTFLSWSTMSQHLKNKLLWENAVKFYGEP